MIQTFKKLENDKASKRQAILAVSLRLFARYGYKKTTVADIAAELGMTKSNIYFYVANKKDLYEKTVGSELLRWRDAVGEEVGEVQDVVEKFRVMVFRAFAYLFSHKELHTIIMNDPGIFTLSREADRFHEINLGAMQLIREVLQQGVDEGRFHAVDVDLTTNLLFSIYIMFLMKTAIRSETDSVMRMIEAGVQLILQGLCKPET